VLRPQASRTLVPSRTQARSTQNQIDPVAATANRLLNGHADQVGRFAADDQLDADRTASAQVATQRPKIGLSQARKLSLRRDTEYRRVDSADPRRASSVHAQVEARAEKQQIHLVARLPHVDWNRPTVGGVVVCVPS